MDKPDGGAVVDATATNLAHDLAAMRQIVHAALDVIAEQHHKIDALKRANLALREELRERMGIPPHLRSATVDGTFSGPETTAAQFRASATENLEASERGRSNL
jgi:hypothetical protein